LGRLLGKHGPVLLGRRLALYGGEQQMVFGATAFRQFVSMLASGTGKPKSLLENLPAVGGTDLDLPGQDAGVSLM
jgi:hypothetical protein